MNSRFSFRIVLAALMFIVLVAPTSLLAEPIPVSTYSMINGDAGSQTYYDDTYGGPGSSGNAGVANSFLSGGTGQLTDGVLAPDADIFNDAWVGWFSPSPTITINVGSSLLVNSIGFYTSNWSQLFNDVGVFGVVNRSYSTDGVTFTSLADHATTVADRTGDLNRWVDIPFAVTAQYLRVTLQDGFKAGGTSPGSKPWVFISEARVDGVLPATVPAPAGVYLTLLGAVALFASRLCT